MKGKIFNSQEVQAILDGSKVMFREVIKPQPIQLKGFSDVYFDCYSKGNPWNWYTKGNKQPLGTIAKCPYQVGQKIFVKESWNAFSGETLGTPLGKMMLYSYPPKQGDIITYKADADLTKDFTS